MKRLLLILLLYATPVAAQSFTVTAAPIPATTASCVFQMNGDNTLPVCTTVTASTATTIAITNDATTNATMYPVWVTTASGSQAAKVTSTKLSFNPSTGMLTATGFTGPLTGTASMAADVTGLDVTAGQTLVVTTGGTLGSAAYTASSAYDVAGAAAAVTPTSLGLVIGTHVQAYSARTTAIAAVADSAGCLSNNGSGTFSYASCGSAATETAITNDTTTNATMYPVWVTANTGSLPLKVTSTKLSYNPSTGMLSSTGFTGALTGNATTATTLATARAIYGNNFDGSAAVTAVILPAYLNATVALTDGSTPALDASLGHTFRLSTTTTPTIAVPTNPTSGQKIIIQFYASGAARTLALNTGTNGFRFGSDITGLTETASGKTDYIGAIWNATDSKWDVVAYAKGY